MRRTLRDIGGLFLNAQAASAIDPDLVVYEVHGCPGEVPGPAKLLYATTVIQPGDVDGEYFMTRGHFHADPARGELMLTLQGEGALILMTRAGQTSSEPMSVGSLHDVDGAHAHRVANTGIVPLIFFVTWMSDCGHEYGPILEHGFSARLFRTSTGPELTAQAN